MLLGSAILETAVGLTLIYILGSLVCSTLNEWLSRWRDLRPSVLETEFGKLLGPNIAGAAAKHPLIRGTFEDGRYPHYLPSTTFALALIDLAYLYTPGPPGLPGSTAVAPRWTGRDRALLEGLRQGATSFGPIQARTERWFELAMEQATGRYKRRVQIQILILSGLGAGLGNIDTLAMARALYGGALAHSATGFPIGWSAWPHSWISSICGILLTWAAISLGAPFWFDVLNKIVNLRQTGLPPDEDARARSGERLIAH